MTITMQDMFNKNHLDWISVRWKSGRKALALRTLEAKLAKIITTANGHRKKNVAKGAPVYQSLLIQAENLIEAFCDTYSVPDSDIYAQMPAMAELRSWGHAATPPPPKPVMFLMAIVGTVLAVFVLGFTSGAAQRLFHWGWMLAHHNL